MPTGIVETIAVRRRAEETSRVHVHLSFAMRDMDELLTKLGHQLKNAVEVDFSKFQLALPEGGVESAPTHGYMKGEVEGKCELCGAAEDAAVHTEQPSTTFCLHDALVQFGGAEPATPPRCRRCGALCRCAEDAVLCPIHANRAREAEAGEAAADDIVKPRQRRTRATTLV